jgi:hypothetical protein
MSPFWIFHLKAALKLKMVFLPTQDKVGLSRFRARRSGS